MCQDCSIKRGAQMNFMRDLKGDITSLSTAFKKIRRGYYNNFMPINLKFLQIEKYQRCIQ